MEEESSEREIGDSAVYAIPSHSKSETADSSLKKPISILWFRHGLRLHDNPAFVAATANKAHNFLPLFIFDGESAGLTLMLVSF